MAIRILSARQFDYAVRFVVHIDSTKLNDGQPDPAWVMRFEFPLPIPTGMTLAQYRADIKSQMRDAILQELDRRRADSEGSALPDEGTDL